MTMNPKKQLPQVTVESWRSSLRIALIYAVFGFIWIIFSDSILSWLVKDPQKLTSIQTYKGWFYVAVTAWLIFVLVRARLLKIEELNRSLREQQEFFRSLIDHSPQAMAVLTMNGDVQNINERFTDLFGYTQEDCPTFEAWQGLTQRDADDRATARIGWEQFASEFLGKDTQAPPFEVKITCKTGTVRDIRCHLRQIGAVAVLTFEDVTDIKNMWKERLDLEAKMAQSNRLESLGVMAGGIAHDFNNILAAIVGFGEMAQMDSPADGSARDSIDKVLAASDRARDLVRQILIFSRRNDQQLKPIDLAQTVEEALSLVTVTLPPTVEIRRMIDPNAGVVLADQTQINQIVFNLCTNSYHAMTEGVGVLVVEVSPCDRSDLKVSTLADLEPGPLVRLRVTDDGSGMDEKTQSRIFEPFFTTKRVGKGAGMGLSVVHGVVGSHNGAMEVESSPGQGTSISVYLPRQDSTTPIACSEEVKAEGGHERILFVDDEPMLAELGQATLESLGYRVVSVTSASQALDLFRDDPCGFDLLVTDQIMPQMSGTELVREVRAVKPDFPIVMCTGFSDVLDHSLVQNAGMLHKPVTRETLALAVRKALD
jgi:PAS domain S-box-containing protein